MRKYIKNLTNTLNIKKHFGHYKIKIGFIAALTTATVIFCVSFLTYIFIPLWDIGVYAADNSDITTEKNTVTVLFTCEYLGIHRKYTSEVMKVSEFIKNVVPSYDSDDILNHPIENYIYNGMELSLDIVFTKQYSVDGIIPFQSEIQYVKTIPCGNRIITREGQNGYGHIHYEEQTINGVRGEPYIVSYDATEEPVNEIIIEGSGGYVMINGISRRYSYYRDVEATAYGGEYFTGRTAKNGRTIQIGMIAVDPSVISLGSSVYIEGADGFDCYNGYYSADDTGADIIGDRIDIYTGEDVNLAWQFGRRMMRIYIF